MPHNITETFLHKAATDAGCEIPSESVAGFEGWSVHRSCRFSLRVFLCILAEGAIVALSKGDVLDKLLLEYPRLVRRDEGLPAEAVGGVLVGDGGVLYAVLARVVQLEQSLPHRLVEGFLRETEGLPQNTTVERLVVQRVGQNRLREGLLRYWQGVCAVSGLDLKEVLRASHIKPWSVCADARERLNVYNALLLAPHLDVLFNDGYVSFADDGGILLSGRFSEAQRGLLGVHEGMSISRVDAAHLPFLAYHRREVFKGV